MAKENRAEVPVKPDGAYRVLHSADWHLGKMLGEHSREEEHDRFLSFLLRQIRALSVDALIVAGDIFDSAHPPQSAVAQYYNFLSELFKQGDCSVIIAAGNHDSPAHLEAPRRVLKALRTHVVGAFPRTPVDALVPLACADSAQVVVAVVPFLRDRDLRTGRLGQSATEIQQELVQGITQRYREVAEAAHDWTIRGVPVLVTGHLTVLGCLGSDSERGIHVGGLGAVGGDCFPEGFAYIALGHLHRPQAAGRETVRYSGSPISLSFSEADDRKEMRVLDFASGRLVQQAPLSIPWSRHLARISAGRESLEAILKAYRPPAGELPAWVEVVVNDPAPGENLYDLVQELVKGREFQVIRVLGRRTKPLTGMRIGTAPITDGIDELLGDPSKVFAHRLDDDPAFTSDERDALKIAFNELCGLHAEQHREQSATVTTAGPELRGGA